MSLQPKLPAAHAGGVVDWGHLKAEDARLGRGDQGYDLLEDEGPRNGAVAPAAAAQASLLIIACRAWSHLLKQPHRWHQCLQLHNKLSLYAHSCDVSELLAKQSPGDRVPAPHAVSQGLSARRGAILQ